MISFKFTFLISFVVLFEIKSLIFLKFEKCEPNWKYFDLNCYKYHPYSYNFFESLFICKEFYNSSILTIYSDEEQDFLNSWLGKEVSSQKNVWLGVQKFSDQNFRFVDGTPLTYFKLKDQLEANENFCAALESEFDQLKWKTKDCRELCYLVCKKPVSKSIFKPQLEVNQTSIETCESKILKTKNQEVIPDELKDIFDYLHSNQEHYIKTLAEAVAIKSVSGKPENRPETIHMVEWFAQKLKKEGVEVELVDIGNQTLPNNQKLALPPVLLGQLGNDTRKKTVCIYGHLDVQPAKFEDGWFTDPFKLIEVDGKLYGRGTTDDKGPSLAWLFVIQAYSRLGIEIPINIKFVFEAMEESQSVGLEEVINIRKNTFFSNVDYIIISDSNWVGRSKPCLTYGLRGLAYFYVEVEGPKKDIHSGSYGGSIQEPMTDLILLMSSLVDSKGKILIPGLMDDVLPVNEKERELYTNIDFDIKCFEADVGVKAALQNNKIDLLMHNWRFPSLSLHGIEGAHSESGPKTVIPGKVIGKFSIRLVPNQSFKKIERLTKKHISKQFKKLNSVNTMKVLSKGGNKAWITDPFHPHFSVGRKAFKYVYGIDPDMTRGGGSIPVTLLFQESLGKNIMLLPIGRSDDGAHGQNEKIDRDNYILGAKVLAAYIYEVAQI